MSNIDVNVWFGDGHLGVGPLKAFATTIHEDGTADVIITDPEWLERLHWYPEEDGPFLQSRCKLRQGNEMPCYDDYLWSPIEGAFSEVPVRVSRFDRV